ncbi:ribonuclease domain-containing protein [Dialister invisus]|uniref:ribonuclease domain-containing protein n=1 Tax=Dialister invisus TaxID=218538 RepID=UPI003AF97F32
MKKFFAAILTVFLSLGLLTACGGGQQHGASSAPAVQSVERSDTGSADKSKSRIRQNKIYTDSDAVQSSENADKGSTNKEKISRQSYTGSTSVSQSGEQFSAKSPGSAEIRVEPDQSYTDKDHVAAYIHIYRKLPPNYITKAEARSLGWKDKGTLDQVAPGKSIGGDRFSNYEKILPDAPGRSWKECDIDYVKGNRNAKRICFSNDGLIYYTSSHYQDFEKVY